MPSSLLLALSFLASAVAPPPLPELDQQIRQLEDLLLDRQKAGTLADDQYRGLQERLGALYILAGKRSAGYRFLSAAAGDSPPLPDDGLRLPQEPAEELPQLPQLASRLVGDTRNPLNCAAAAFIYIVAGMPEEAAGALERLPAAAQPLRQWLNALFLHETGQAQTAAAAARGVASAWEGRAPLLVRNLAFIAPGAPVAFGVFTPLERPEFAPGELLVLYYELAGFKAEKIKQSYSIRLQVDFCITDEAGAVMWRKPTPDLASHATRTELHDLFLTSTLYAPTGLAPGRYAMRIEITDLVASARTVAQAYFTFRASR